MRNKILTLLLFICASMCAMSARCEVYSLDEARELYKAGKYEDAAPTFMNELKRKPNNGSLNHWYGVCLYETGRYEDALPYLEKGASRKVLLSNLYLGKAYAALYRFDDAIEKYTTYFSILKKDEKEPSFVERQLLSKAQLGKRMMRGVENVQVIDSITVDSLSFINYYRLSPEAGSVIDTENIPEESLNVDYGTLAFMPQRGDVLYMGQKLQSDYDLYQSGTLLGGGWSALHPMSEVLNTADNQRYPYLLNDGQTLYFAQDGDNSLGGYDIFVTLFNSERGDYMLPQNIGMPFNSPYNDFMMAIDETIGVGWFVTDRNQIADSLTIYIFIPNAEKTIYNDREEDRLRMLAQLTSIADTWQEGRDYSEFLSAIENVKVVKAMENKHEFFFVLCNGIVYTQSSDFRNKEALRYYNQARSAQSKLDENQALLTELRSRYAVASRSQKDELATHILDIEAYILAEADKPQMYENRARRAELNYVDE